MIHQRRFVLLLLFISSQAVWAHDFFLLPSKFRLQSGDSVRIYIHVSETFPGSAQNWNPDRANRFLHVIGSQTVALTSTASQDSPRAVVVALKDPGTHLFALDWKARFIELKSDQFLHYLQSEGLDQVIELRKQRGESEKPGRERYSRYVKTLVQVGRQPADSIDDVIGQRIEIVPTTNPYKLKVGDSLQVRVLFEGQPLRNALVSATYAGYTDKPDTYAQGVRTDREGKAVFRLTHPGAWMVRTVHMVPLQGSQEADWESFWASLTFEVQK